MYRTYDTRKVLAKIVVTKSVQSSSFFPRISSSAHGFYFLLLNGQTSRQVKTGLDFSPDDPSKLFQPLLRTDPFAPAKKYIITLGKTRNTQENIINTNKTNTKLKSFTHFIRVIYPDYFT